jgi:hypothetical protein
VRIGRLAKPLKGTITFGLFGVTHQLICNQINFRWTRQHTIESFSSDLITRQKNEEEGREAREETKMEEEETDEKQGWFKSAFLKLGMGHVIRKIPEGEWERIKERGLVKKEGKGIGYYKWGEDDESREERDKWTDRKLFDLHKEAEDLRKSRFEEMVRERERDVVKEKEATS